MWGFLIVLSGPGIIYFTPKTFLRETGTALTGGHCPSASCFLRMKLMLLFWDRETCTLEEVQRLTVLSSCHLWMSIYKARLIHNPFQSFFLGLMCPSCDVVSPSDKVIQVFYQPSKCLSRIPLPGLVVVMNTSIPVSCTYLVITDSLGAGCCVLHALHIFFLVLTPFVLILVAKYTKHLVNLWMNELPSPFFNMLGKQKTLCSTQVRIFCFYFQKTFL